MFIQLSLERKTNPKFFRVLEEYASFFLLDLCGENISLSRLSEK